MGLAWLSRMAVLATILVLSVGVSNAHGDLIQVNAITLSYFPVIMRPGLPGGQWPLDTRQKREALGLNPSSAPIDDRYGEYNWTLAQVRQRVTEIEAGVASALENGTRFRAYERPTSKKGIKYNVLSRRELLYRVPLSSTKTYFGFPLPDYFSMMRNANICYWVDVRHVQEVWIFGYQGAGYSLWESNFSSKSGDISNSDRDPSDLPLCGHSYTVYHYNYGRYISEAIEDHMHQFEAIFSSVDQDLFGTFVGFPAKPMGIRRCGNAHYPPNGMTDYDWNNSVPQTSDCEDWHPVGFGRTRTLSCSRWNCESLPYFIYWMQNIPGFYQRLTDCNPSDAKCVPQRQLKNWWSFIYRFDSAYADRTFWRALD